MNDKKTPLVFACIPPKLTLIQKINELVDKAHKLNADGVEIRLDKVSGWDFRLLEKLVSHIKSCGLKTILTLRSKAEGGAFRDGKVAYSCWIGMMIRKIGQDSLPIDFLDIELWLLESDSLWQDNAKTIETMGVRVIVSYHNFEETPKDLDGIMSRIKKFQPCTPKIAVMAQSPGDVQRTREFLEKLVRDGEQAIIIPMGRLGTEIRLSPLNLVCFASLDEKRVPVASGQPTVAEAMSHR